MICSVPFQVGIAIRAGVEGDGGLSDIHQALGKAVIRCCICFASRTISIVELTMSFSFTLEIY
jgi:hypothetical protein